MNAAHLTGGHRGEPAPPNTLKPSAARGGGRALRRTRARPKPGLVSFADSGSHDDMDARTLLRSLFSLRLYFPRLAELGAIAGVRTAGARRH